jgi:hypothetical protein
MTTATRTKFEFIVEDGLNLSQEVPDKVDWLVEGLVPKEGLTLIGSKPKAGKSTLVTQLLVDIAEGRPFLGRSTKRVDCLHLHLEGPKAYPGMRFKELGHTRAHGKIDVFRRTMPKTLDEGLDALMAFFTAKPNFKVLTIDTLPKLLRLMDSDKYDQTVLAMERLEKLAQFFHIQIISAVHAKKRAGDEPGDSLLGSTAFRAASDTNIFLTREGDQRIISTEQRLGEHLEPHQLNLDRDTKTLSLGKSIEEIESKRESGTKLTRQRIESAIVEKLLESGRLSQTDLAKNPETKVTGKAETIVSVLDELEAHGRLAVVEEGLKKWYSLAVIETEREKAA